MSTYADIARKAQEREENIKRESLKRKKVEIDTEEQKELLEENQRIRKALLFEKTNQNLVKDFTLFAQKKKMRVCKHPNTGELIADDGCFVYTFSFWADYIQKGKFIFQE